LTSIAEDEGNHRKNDRSKDDADAETREEIVQAAEPHVEAEEETEHRTHPYFGTVHHKLL
jgi:hypothetical protein